MAINVFEGARRIATLTAGLWVLGWGAFGIFEPQPHIGATYTVAHLHAKPTLGDPSCEYGPNARDYLEVMTKKGTQVHVTLCFIAQRSSDGQLVVPFARDPNDNRRWMGNDQHSIEVREYVKQVRDGFAMSLDEERMFDRRLWPARLERIGIGALFVFGGLFVFWMFCWTLGWIVRGFLGIPMGRDARVQVESERVEGAKQT
jgi:hypothetical protein